MEESNLNTRPLHTLSAYEATSRLQQVIKQAYFRRSRQVPANVADIVETLKADILRVMPAVTVNQIDEAVTDWVLNQIEKPLSPAFFFAAIRSRYEGPRRTRAMDVDEYTRPDTEEDYLSLMDTLAAFIDHRPIFFDPWREYRNLVERGQLDEGTVEHYIEKAMAKIQQQRVKEGNIRRITMEPHDNSVQATARRLAVEDWLRSCVTANITPSKILKKQIP